MPLALIKLSECCSVTCCVLQIGVRAPQSSGALPHAIALFSSAFGLVVKGKTRALHEANDIVLCQIDDKASDHI